MPTRPHNCMRWAERADDAARAVLAFDTAVDFARLAVSSAQGDVRGTPARTTAPLGTGAAADGSSRAGPAHGAAGRGVCSWPIDVTESIEACVAAADLAEEAARPDLLAQAALVIHGLGDPSANRTIPRPVRTCVGPAPGRRSW